MFSHLRPAILSILVFTILTGLLYPLAVTGIAQALFAEKANGSIIYRGDQPIGSKLIGQPFDDPRYFWGRLSATSPAYNAAASSGSNHGPLNPALIESAQARIDSLRSADPTAGSVPIDLVTSSGSGLDPHISPAAAVYQVKRVAGARQMNETEVHALVERFTEQRTFGVLGENRVNVLKLNLALDEAGR